LKNLELIKFLTESLNGIADNLENGEDVLMKITAGVQEIYDRQEEA
jgi:hypothetical protein